MDHEAPLPDGPVGWDDLPALDAAAVALRNADLALLGRHVFTVGGVPVRFEQALPAPQQGAAGGPGGQHAAQQVPHGAPVGQDVQQPAWEPAVWLWLEWSGAPLLAGVSAAWAGAVAQALAGLGLDQVGEQSLDLLCQFKLAPKLPAGLTLRQAALSRQALHDAPSGLTRLGAWVGRHPATQEPSAHAVELWAGPGFALQALLRAFVPLATQQLPAPLAAVPIALPLVAARWQVRANELQDLAVGDVLVLG